jgi:hypothetical protein
VRQHVFGANGVVLDEMDDYQAERENRSIDLGICIQTTLGFHASLGVLAWTTTIQDAGMGILPLQIGSLTTALLSLAAGFVGFHIEAKNRGAPSLQGIARSDHITGFGAFVGLLLLATIVIAAVLGQLNYMNFTIPEQAGYGAFAILGAGFLLIAFAPRVTNVSGVGQFVRILRGFSAPLDPIGRVMSLIDSWLVYSVAPVSGSTLKSVTARYGVLTFHLAAATMFTWYGAPPFGLFGMVWGIIVAVAVARRWAWAEAERAKHLAQPTLQPSELRVDTEQDLRNLALWGLILLVLVLPIGMRQFYLAMQSNVVFLTSGAEDDPSAWLGFFGVELLKALPFIDWAEVYGAEGLTRIEANSPLALHAVFAARVLIDLVFIGALVQAISISVSLSRHKRQFLLNQGVHVLDPRIEKFEIAKLARLRHGQWEYSEEISQFIHYDSHRLSRLRLGAAKGSRLHAALVRLFELKGLQFAPPGEQLVDVAKDAKPDRPALEAALALVAAEGHFDLEYLSSARQFLNRKGEIEDIRQRIVLWIATRPVSPDRNRVLVDIVRGNDMDSLAPVRILAVDALGRIARQNPEAVDALIHVMNNDRAPTVRRKAVAVIKARGLVTDQPRNTRAAAA